MRNIQFKSFLKMGKKLGPVLWPGKLGVNSETRCEQLLDPKLVQMSEKYK